MAKCGPSIAAMLFALQDGKCFFCGLPMYGRPTYQGQKNNKPWTVDHLLPVRMGGIYSMNAVLSHLDCNCKKSDRAPTNDEQMRAASLHSKLASLLAAFNGIPMPGWEPAPDDIEWFERYTPREATAT